MTKKELEEQLKVKNEEVRELKKQIEKVSKEEQFDEVAKTALSIVNAFVKQGFSREEAIKFIEASISAS